MNNNKKNIKIQDDLDITKECFYEKHNLNGSVFLKDICEFKDKLISSNNFYNYLNPIEYMSNEEYRKDVDNVLHLLTPRQELIIRLRTGIKDNKKYSIDEIGKILSATRARVRQIESMANQKLFHIANYNKKYSDKKTM